ncbi:redoxin domain-containing protein [Allorhodopirellula heiligendammensis]|uniref:Thiol-disulfide oxidoreductase n=1 Tax=Allorhodopirellula heiligendammensis TaxID=2714739 RepID=A0A5C6C006_9BACT|nr:redoxin domain-containing protein [Allorhodopirellula heiligendammensis]TWU16209.1 thiol-disulfide oxidoreductase [Allorhodopirellula heiligendammensis]
MNIHSRLSYYAGVLVLLCLFSVSAVQAAKPISLLQWMLRDGEGQSIILPPSDYTVVCFLGTECPLARLYGPRLQRLADAFGDKGVTFLGVDSNAQDSPAEITAYARELGITFPIAKDADQSVLVELDAERTPEVFIIDAAGRVLYQGRIDDQYKPGLARAEPTQHDLRDAIEALLAGNPVAQAETPGVGCLITRIPQQRPAHAEQATVTFTADVAPILNQHCVECHRDSEIAPFALTDYDEVVGWGQMMLEVIDQKRMPPWHADPRIGHFVGERRMPADARDTIAAWIAQGMVEGDPGDLPPTPKWHGGWHLASDPDMEIAMRDRPFRVPSDDVVDYQYYVVDPGWKEDRWIRAAQVVPGDASVVHHAIVFVRSPDGSDSRGIGWLGAYVPGQRTAMLPPGHARRIPAGSKLVFQMHYTPNGRQTEDISRVGVWFADPDEVTHEVFTRVAIDHDFEIPPRVEDYEVGISLDGFGPESRLLGATPHMHLRGKSFQLRARLANGTQEDLLHVPHYDFNWQHYYQFAEPLKLDAIESLDMIVTFDNSTANPANPAPDDYVTWGDQTWEEMAIAFFDVARPLKGSQPAVDRQASSSSQAERSNTESVESSEQRLVAQRAIDRRTQTFLNQMDQNGDGQVQREETPLTFQRFGFKQMDRNRDGVLDHDEVAAAAAER